MQVLIRSSNSDSVDSGPPSPAHSDATVNTWQDEHGDVPFQHPQLVILRKIFTDEVCGEIYATRKNYGTLLANAAIEYVEKQTLSLDDYHGSVDGLLDHFGVRTPEPEQKGRLRLLLERVIHLLPFTSTKAMATAFKTDPAKTLQVMATVYIRENPGGGIGYSFGMLVERVVLDHLVLHDTLYKNIYNNLIGGSHGRYSPCSRTDSVRREDASQGSVAAMVHSFSAKLAASSGPGLLMERVKEQDLMELSKLSTVDMEKNVILYHGTSIEAATAIIRRGPEARLGPTLADFGPGFYLTDSLPYAVHVANQAKGKSLISAVLVFVIAKKVLKEYQILDLRGKLTDWKQVVKNGLRRLYIKQDALEATSTDADYIIGPICQNVDLVQNKQKEPLCSPWNQWSVRQSMAMHALGRGIIRKGKLQVFRFLHENADDWASTTGETGEGSETPLSPNQRDKEEEPRCSPWNLRIEQRPLRVRFKKADYIVGPICQNVDLVQNKQKEPLCSPWNQWSFKDEMMAEDVLDEGIIRKDKLQVFRFLHENVETGEGNETPLCPKQRERAEARAKNSNGKKKGKRGN